jgi:flavin-dependent dehydrogenase
VIYDVAIAGGGPAGLAAAIRAAQRGLRAIVLERSPGPIDKACGEGLMPSGARELELLGACVEPAQPFRGIRYLQEGTVVEAPFRGGTGLGIRRTVLSRALSERALALGAELRRATVQAGRAGPRSIEVATDAGPIEARLLIAADGLHSPLRRMAGLEMPGSRLQASGFRSGLRPRAPGLGKSENTIADRFGIRRHFAIAPWSDFVEVYWADGVEAYVTPVGPRSVNVAFLCGRGAAFEEHLDRFPTLRQRLQGAEPESEIRGAGPLLQRVRARHADRLALLGDAAGYVDAITGQGLSLAFAGAALLMDALPEDLSRDLAPALRAYDRGLRSRWLRYAVPAHALLALSRRPALRSKAIRSVAALPGSFGALVQIVG